MRDLSDPKPADRGDTEPTVSRSELLDLLNTEIRDCFDKQSRQGWTTWALAGAIGALGWLLIGRLESGAFSWAKTFRILLTIEVFYLSASLLKYAFWPAASQGRSGRFRYYDEYLLSITLLALLYCIGLMAIAFIFSAELWWIHVLVVEVFFFLVALICILGVIVRLYRIPLEFATGPPDWPTKIVISALTLPVIVSGAMYALRITGFQFDDLRIAILIAAIADLASRLTKSLQGAATVQTLSAIRRELALGRIDVRAAANQTEIALAGMGVGDVLQEEVRAFLDAIGKINAAFDDAITRIGAVLSDVPQPEQTWTTEKATVARTVLDVCEERTKNAFKDYDTVKERLSKLRSRIRWVGRKTEESSRGVDEVYKTIYNALDEIVAKSKDYRSKAKNLAERLDISARKKYFT